jgi:hypothetical protein
VIVRVVRVTGRECWDQIRYLAEHSDVNLAAPIQAGHLVLEKGFINDVRYLGNYHTIFTELGGLRAQNVFGRRLFRVEEISEILHRDECTDARSRQRYDDLVRRLEDRGQSPNITIDPVAEIIQDGNKTAAAYHSLYSLCETCDLSVFLVRPPARHEPGGCP